MAYKAAGQGALVGGDWYDAFILPDGRLFVAIGDVEGSGLDAAVVMAGMRHAMRGAAQLSADPAAILNAADGALCSHYPDKIVTAFVGVLDLHSMHLDYASAGHPWPLLRYGGGSIQELYAYGLPLGLRLHDKALSEASRTMTLPKGALFVMYTDGLTEASPSASDGETRLRTILAHSDILNTDHAAPFILKLIIARPIDDVAVFTLRT